MSARVFRPGVLLSAGVALLAGCSSSPPVAPDAETAAGVDPQLFLERLAPYCERAYNGRVAVDQPASPEAIWQQPLVLYVRCEGRRRLLSLNVGEDRSRVWLLLGTGAGLRLGHMHHGNDGKSDDISGYGGLAVNPAESPDRVEFRPDEAAQTLFREQGRLDAMNDAWAFELVGDDVLAYEQTRPGRVFRLEFDLSQPVTPLPPLPWAEAPIQ